MRRNFICFLLLTCCTGCSRSQEPSLLDSAINRQNYQLVEKLLNEGANSNQRDPFRAVPLEWAIRNDDTLMLELLIDHGANIYYREPVLGNSFLTDCAYSNKLKAARFLMEHGLSPDFTDSVSGNSSLMDAVAAANVSMVSLLLGFGANLNYINAGMGTALNSAIYWHSNANAVLKEKVRSMSMRDSIAEDHLPKLFTIIQILLKAGASPNSPGFDGDGTCLHDAASYCDSSVVQLLLQYGADKNAKDDSGERPYDIAVKNDCKDLEAILK
jgi:ankyrin repeat protein